MTTPGPSAPHTQNATQSKGNSIDSKLGGKTATRKESRAADLRVASYPGCLQFGGPDYTFAGCPVLVRTVLLFTSSNGQPFPQPNVRRHDGVFSLPSAQFEFAEPQVLSIFILQNAAHSRERTALRFFSLRCDSSGRLAPASERNSP